MCCCTIIIIFYIMMYSCCSFRTRFFYTDRKTTNRLASQLSEQTSSDVNVLREPYTCHKLILLYIGIRHINIRSPQYNNVFSLSDLRNTFLFHLCVCVCVCVCAYYINTRGLATNVLIIPEQEYRIR